MSVEISMETAEKDFIQWCEANEIEIDAGSSEEEVKDFEVLKKTVTKAIVAGRCIVDGENLKYRLSEKNAQGYAGKEITIRPPNGRIFMATDGYKETQAGRKMNAMMSAITGLDAGFFGNIYLKDYKFLQAVLVLFLSM